MLRTLTFQVYSFEEIDASMEVKTIFFPSCDRKKGREKEKKKEKGKLSAPILQHVSENQNLKATSINTLVHPYNL